MHFEHVTVVRTFQTHLDIPQIRRSVKVVYMLSRRIHVLQDTLAESANEQTSINTSRPYKHYMTTRGNETGSNSPPQSANDPQFGRSPRFLSRITPLSHEKPRTTIVHWLAFAD